MYGIIFIHNYKSKKQRSVKIKIRSFDKIFKNTKIALYQQKNRPKIFNFFGIGFEVSDGAETESLDFLCFL